MYSNSVKNDVPLVLVCFPALPYLSDTYAIPPLRLFSTNSI